MINPRESILSEETPQIEIWPSPHKSLVSFGYVSIADYQQSP